MAAMKQLLLQCRETCLAYNPSRNAKRSLLHRKATHKAAGQAPSFKKFFEIILVVQTTPNITALFSCFVFLILIPRWICTAN